MKASVNGRLWLGAFAVALVSGCSSAVPVPESTAASTSTTAVVATETPAARMGHAMVAIGDGELLVFGGRSYQGTAEVFLDDTWIYDTVDGNWREVVGSGPLARSQHAMAYDTQRDEVLLFGGYVGSSFTYGDTWILDLGSEAWTRVQPATTPTARAGSVAVFDTVAAGYVMFAGAEEPPAAELPLAETWLFDPDLGDWRQAVTSTVPILVSEGHPTLFELAMVYDDPAERSMLLVAGESTWSFASDSEQWTRVDSGHTQGLGADYMTAAAFDRAGRVTVAYGGAPVERTAATWRYDARDDLWSELAGTTPGPLANHAMAYDATTDAVYLFGGAAAVLVLDGVPPVSNQMWTLTDQGWQLR